MAKKTVMIVDDDHIILRVIADILDKEGYKVITALDGPEALRKLKKAKPDLILLDVLMPGMSGIDLLKKIRANPKLKNLNIVILTILTFTRAQKKALKKFKILSYIHKPFDNKELVKMVNKMIKKSKA